MKVEIVCATKDQQLLMSVDLPEKSTVSDAIRKSKLFEKLTEFEAEYPNYKTGIFSVICDKNKILSEGDRVEIYRPLKLDTMTRRFDKVKKDRKKQLMLKLQSGK